MHTVDIFSKTVEIVSNLQTEFTCRTKDDGLCFFSRCISFLQQRQSIGSSFTCSCLCQCNDIVFVTQQIRDYFFLYWHWMFESKLVNSAANLFADAQFFKCFQCFFTLIILLIKKAEFTLPAIIPHKRYGI